MSADPTADRAIGRAAGRAFDRAAHRAASAAAGPAASSSPADAGAPGSGPVLDIRDLSIVYRTPAGDVRAVDQVNLALGAGEVVGLAGESGSGKSTLAYGATRLLRAPALVTNGSVIYRGRRVTVVSAWGVEGQPPPAAIEPSAIPSTTTPCAAMPG